MTAAHMGSTIVLMRNLSSPFRCAFGPIMISSQIGLKSAEGHDPVFVKTTGTGSQWQ